MIMRLAVVRDGLRPLQKLVLRIIRLAAGFVPGPILIHSYRKEVFGKPFADCFQEAMRRSTRWTVGEVELMAAFVSRINHCAF